MGKSLWQGFLPGLVRLVPKKAGQCKAGKPIACKPEEDALYLQASRPHSPPCLVSSHGEGSICLFGGLCSVLNPPWLF